MAASDDQGSYRSDPLDSDEEVPKRPESPTMPSVNERLGVYENYNIMLACTFFKRRLTHMLQSDTSHVYMVLKQNNHKLG